MEPPIRLPDKEMAERVSRVLWRKLCNTGKKLGQSAF